MLGLPNKSTNLVNNKLINASSPGPIAPIKWVAQVVNALDVTDVEAKKKIMLGLNFYGFDFIRMWSW